MSALGSYPLLSKVLDLIRADLGQEANFSTTEQTRWLKELEAASGDKAVLEAVLTELQTQPAKGETDFWAWLEQLVFRGGFEEQVKKLARSLSDRFVSDLEPLQRQKLMVQLNDRRASYFFSAGRWLTPDLIARNFPVDFVADWVIARCFAYGDDGATSDLWRLLQWLAEERPLYAFNLARVPAFAAKPDGRKFQVDLLGGLRFRPDLPSEVSGALPAVLESMRTSTESAERANYWRTMKRPLGQGRLPDAELEQALAATAVSEEEYGVGYELAKAGSQEPTPKAQTLRLLQWLQAQFDQQRTPEQQYDAATVVWLTVEHVTPEELGFDVVDLLLKIQPVDIAHLGIWQQIGHALHPLSSISRERFQRVLRLIARNHWVVLLKMLERNAPLHGAMRRLGERPDETAAFAAELTASKSQGERRLGFHLIENLQLPEPTEPSGLFSRESFTVWISEFRLNLVYQTVAQQLVSAAARIDQADADMVQAFQEEVLYQCKNLPGLCLAQLKEKREEVSLLEGPINEAEKYFTALRNLDDSPIKAQQIPGLVRAIHRKRVRDREKMEEYVAAHSIFEQFAKKSYLIYGRRWAVFNGGVLGPESALEEHSVSAEYPRKAVIDPEGLLGIRLTAQTELNRLNQSDEEDEEDAL